MPKKPRLARAWPTMLPRTSLHAGSKVNVDDAQLFWLKPTDASSPSMDSSMRGTSTQAAMPAATLAALPPAKSAKVPLPELLAKSMADVTDEAVMAWLLRKWKPTVAWAELSAR